MLKEGVGLGTIIKNMVAKSLQCIALAMKSKKKVERI
jgi:hypothetical protein